MHVEEKYYKLFYHPLRKTRYLRLNKSTLTNVVKQSVYMIETTS